MTKPSENISLKILQLEHVWISGAVKSKFGCAIFDKRVLHGGHMIGSTASVSWHFSDIKLERKIWLIKKVFYFAKNLAKFINLPINSNPANFQVPRFVMRIDEGQTFLWITWPE